MTNKWIEGAIKNPGAFTAKAKKRGMTPAEFQQEVLSNKDRYPDETIKQANLRKTLVKFNR